MYFNLKTSFYIKIERFSILSMMRMNLNYRWKQITDILVEVIERLTMQIYVTHVGMHACGNKRLEIKGKNRGIDDIFLNVLHIEDITNRKKEEEKRSY